MRAALAALSVLLVLAGAALVVHRAIVPRPALDLTPSAAPPPAAPPPREVGMHGGGPRVDSAWVEQTARRAGLPSTALRAYAQASLVPVGECRVGWTTLAAIGWVESRHGTLGGRGLSADGRSTSAILGPALDGSPGFAAIRATPEGTAWHGDRVWEHAVGPMQFLPETWEAWAADGDGDGLPTPVTWTTPRPPRPATCAPAAATWRRGPAGRAACCPTTARRRTSPTCAPPRRPTPSAPAAEILNRTRGGRGRATMTPPCA